MFQSCEAKVNMQLAGQKLRQSFLFYLTAYSSVVLKLRQTFVSLLLNAMSQPNIAHICCQRSRLNVR